MAACLKKKCVFFGAKCGGVAQGVRVRFLAGKFVPLLSARFAPNNINKGKLRATQSSLCSVFNLSTTVSYWAAAASCGCATR